MLGHMKTFDVTFGSSKFVIFVSNQSLVLFNVQIIVLHNEGQIQRFGTRKHRAIRMWVKVTRLL